MAPHLEVIAPWRLWNLRSREEMLDYLEKRDIPCAASKEKIYSRDRNLWHISHEGGALEDPWNAPPEDIWVMSVSPEKAPDKAEEVVLGFVSGRARTLNGNEMAAEKLVAELNVIGGRHGVGRIDLIENRLVGMKSRGCYETPGGTIIMEALRGLEEIVLDRDTRAYRQEIAEKFAYVVYNRWSC